MAKQIPGGCVELCGDGHHLVIRPPVPGLYGELCAVRLRPRAEARGQDERMRDHPDALLGVEEHVCA